MRFQLLLLLPPHDKTVPAPGTGERGGTVASTPDVGQAEQHHAGFPDGKQIGGRIRDVGGCVFKFAMVGALLCLHALISGAMSFIIHTSHGTENGILYRMLV